MDKQTVENITLITIILLLVAFTLLVLSGCGGGDDGVLIRDTDCLVCFDDFNPLTGEETVVCESYTTNSILGCA